MRKYTIDKLEITVKKAKAKAAKTRKIKYDLARSLGFSAQESIILQFKNEKVIRELADERHLKQLSKGE